ncbi:MAG: hypothetical protein AB7T49_13885 [Oligoflexales bacterium]
MSTTLQIVKPEEYFRTEVHSAVSSLKINLDSQIEYYLVNLLCDFIEPRKDLDGEQQIDVFNTPLAIMLKSAMEATPDTKVKIYKRLGDTSLYFAGFFQEYFNKKTFDVSYYITMGSTAYNNISEIVRYRHSDAHFTKMYQDLAKEFKNLVEVIATISEQFIDRTDKNLLATYERWTKTQSDRLRKILENEGINPININFKQAQ